MDTTSTPKKPLSSLLPQLLGFTTTITLLLLQSANSQQTSFTFSRFNDDTDLVMQGASSFSRDLALQLTDVDTNGSPLGNSVGRTICAFPVPFWNRTTGRVSTISTSFVLNITSPPNNNNSTPIADGIAFFIASFSAIPDGSGGEFLGIFSNQSDFTNFVAVEFDTYPNVDIGDPNYRHVGVDVNSVVSLGSAEWEWRNGEPFNVTINYDGSSKGLRVFGSYPDGSGVDFTSEVDLTTVLPEWGFAGFSATTGEYSQVNHVNSWSFSSILGENDIVEEGGIASVV